MTETPCIIMLTLFISFYFLSVNCNPEIFRYISESGLSMMIILHIVWVQYFLWNSKQNTRLENTLAHVCVGKVIFKSFMLSDTINGYTSNLSQDLEDVSSLHSIKSF